MIQKALKFILKDRFGRNSSPNAFLNDQSRHELFTRSPSTFSNLKTSLREAYQRLRSKTSPVIGLTYLLPVGQMALFSQGLSEMSRNLELREKLQLVMQFQLRIVQFCYISSSSRCTRCAITRKD